MDLEGKTAFSDMVALEERKQNGIFIVYPNPNTGKFTLKLNDKNATNCRVMNALGQVIKQVFLETNETSLDLVGAKPGIYWVEVKANDLLWFQKIQVN